VKKEKVKERTEELSMVRKNRKKKNKKIKKEKKKKRKIKNKTIFLSIIIVLTVVISTIIFINIITNPSPPSDEELEILVGQYDNPPKIFEDDDGKVVGIFPDLLEYIALQEGWTIKYIKGSWTECLERLENNDIDIMVDVAYSDSRAEKYDFNNFEILTNWGVVYGKDSSLIESLDDLENKKIAVMEGSIHTDGEEGIKNLTKKLNINCTFIELENYYQVLEMVEEGGADAGVVNRLFGLLNENEYNIKRTSIIFNPRKLMFAFPKDAEMNKILIPKIDNHLLALKEDTDSLYYQIIDMYIYHNKQIGIPDWIIPTLIASIGLLITFGFSSAILKKAVNKKTIELFRENTKRAQSLRETEFLLDLTRAISESPNFNTALSVFIRLTIEFCGWIFGETWIPDTNRNILVFNDQSCYFNRENEKLNEFKFESMKQTFLSGIGLPGRVWSSKQSEWNQDVSSMIKEEYLRVEHAKKAGIKTGFGIPIISNDEILAVIVFYTAEPSIEDERFIEIISTIATQLSIALRFKQVQDELKKSEAKYRVLFESAPIGIITTDLECNVLTFNQSMLNLMGYTSDELSKITLEDTYDNFDDYKKLLKNLHEFRGVRNWEVKRKRKDGTIYDALISTELMEVEDQIILLTTMMDITQRKKAEVLRRDFSQKLELDVAERTNELKEANIKLKELDQLKSMFLASMSHELRTPLNSIIGFTGWLLMDMEGALNEEQRKQLNLVKSSANHLLDLINDILDISKIEAGKVDVCIEMFKFSEIVDDVINSTQPLANDKGLKIIYDIPEGLIIKSDKLRIKQIVMNLISNAIKFTEQGYIKINVKSLNNTNLEVIVLDTGIGMKKEDINKLFIPFQQIDMSSTKKHEGTGLGLYLCKKLLNLLQGDISVKSQFGKGSEFKFIIPIKYKEEG